MRRKVLRAIRRHGASLEAAWSELRETPNNPKDKEGIFMPIIKENNIKALEIIHSIVNQIRYTKKAIAIMYNREVEIPAWQAEMYV